MQRTLVATLALLVIFASVLVWGLGERHHYLTALKQRDDAIAEIGKWQEATMKQDDAIKDWQAKASAAHEAAQAARRKADASEVKAKQEHARLQKLIDAPSQQKSCDSAWDDIEHQQADGSEGTS